MDKKIKIILGAAVLFGVAAALVLFLQRAPLETGVINGSESPAGDRHPGEIIHDDKVDARVWTRRADEVPQSIAWKELNGKWVPVVRIEITGIPGRREITYYGPGDQFLESAIQAPSF